MLVETRVGRLFVEVVGEGPDVVLWHSLLCDGGMWREQVRAFSPLYRMIVIDAPGHGRSAPIRRGFTMDECVDAALAVMDACDVRAPVFCGLSWGGMVGMRLAAANPDRLSGLALLSTSARAERSYKKPPYAALAAIARTLGPPRPLCKLIEPLFFCGDTRRERPEIVRSFSARLAAMDRQSLGHAVDAVIFERDDVTAQLGAIRVPTLVIVGDEDRATPPLEAEILARAIPGARLVRIPRAGHIVVQDRPDSVNVELARFFAEATRGVAATQSR